MTLETLQPHWPQCSRVVVHSTTRAGGVSRPPFDALNLGLHVGDDASAVAENRTRLQKALALPSAPVWLRQVHGVDIARIDDSSTWPASATADAATTTTPGIVLAVMTADCLPVVVRDRTGTQVAVAHAGWRGLAAGILERVVHEFAAGAELQAWLGPAIGPTAFEVGEEVLAAFAGRDSQAASAFVPTGTSGKYLADLYALARLALTRTRRVSISGGEHCTLTQARHFHSHRRDGANSGRQATLAWITGDDQADTVVAPGTR